MSLGGCPKWAVALIIVSSAVLGGIIPHTILLWHVTQPPVDFISSDWVDGTEVCAGSETRIKLHFHVNRVGPVELVQDWHRSDELGGDSIPGTEVVRVINARSGTVTDPDIILRVPDILPPGAYTRMTSVISLSGYSRASIREELVTVVDCP